MNMAWDYQEKVRFVHSLGRGAQPMVVLLYQIFRCAMTVEEMQDRSNLSSDAIRLAIKRMAAKGLIHKQVGEHGRVTWLPLGDTLYSVIGQSTPLLESQVKVLPDSEVKALPDSVDGVVVGQYKNKVSSITSSSSSGQIKEKPDSGLSDNDKARQKALRSAGIGRIKWDELLECEWVTVEYIQAHSAWIKSEGDRWDNPVGMLITRMLNEQAPPEPRQPVSKKRASYEIPQVDTTYEHEDDCNCFQCRRDYPERFCSYAGKPCGSKVIPGHRFCSKHLKTTSNKTSESE